MKSERGLVALIVDRPVAVLMLFLAAGVFGLVSFSQLALNLMPDISFPTITVRTEFPGAAPAEVEQQVSRMVEEALATTDGLSNLQSRSRAELSDVVLQFGWDADMHVAAQSIREQLQGMYFPQGVGRPLVLRYDPSLDPILRLALSSGEEGSAHSLNALREFAEDEVRPALEGMAGVAAVKVRGGLERQVQVLLYEDRMVARGVSLARVRDTLSNENVNVAGGLIREGDNEYLLRVLGEFSSLEDLRNLGIARDDGSRILLSDLADVVEGFRDREVVSLLDGREAVELEIYKEAQANIVRVSRTVKDWLEETEDLGVEVRVLDDRADFIEASISNLLSTALFGGVLAVTVLLLFLRDLRASAIVATAIPISIICTFAPLYIGGVSLNIMSLGGLALGVGMLVDNAIVVLESIQVHRERGLGRREAAIAGTREVAAAVTASHRRIWASARSSSDPILGLAITSAAPKDRAFIAFSLPLAVKLEQITTGIGCCAMIRRRKVSPSMRGSARSRTSTSGSWPRIFSAAWKASAAVAMTAIPGSAESSRDRAARAAALSSTIITRIGSVPWLIVRSPSF